VRPLPALPHASIALTTLRLSRSATEPKTTWRPSRCAGSDVVMKNCEPLEPAFLFSFGISEKSERGERRIHRILEFYTAVEFYMYPMIKPCRF